MTDAEKVLRWMGYEEDLQSGWWMKHGETHMRADDQQDGWSSPIDANWITGTLIPALEERLGCAKYGIQHRKGQVIIVLDLPRKDSYDLGMDLVYGYGPTFEAAMISAAAKAVRSAER